MEIKGERVVKRIERKWFDRVVGKRWLEKLREIARDKQWVYLGLKVLDALLDAVVDDEPEAVPQEKPASKKKSAPKKKAKKKTADV